MGFVNLTKEFLVWLSDSGVNPQETVFIDDNLGNAMAAQNAGLNAFHDAGLEIEKELTAMLSAF